MTSVAEVVLSYHPVEIDCSENYTIMNYGPTSFLLCDSSTPYQFCCNFGYILTILQLYMIVAHATI